jgi:hemerythrin
MTINWEPEKMTAGIGEIDEQHKEWIHRFNEFDDAVTGHRGVDAIQDALDFFMQYTNTHFAFEEACMEKYNCPAQSENYMAHAEFQEKLSQIESWVEDGEASLIEVFELKSVLEEWLVNHICTIDVQLRTVA